MITKLGNKNKDKNFHDLTDPKAWFVGQKFAKL